MIQFICPNVDVKKLKDAVKKALIRCVAEAVEPLYGDYKRTGLDYSSCKSQEEMRLVFAEYHLGDVEIEEIDDGIILHDSLDIEGTCNRDAYDLEQFLLDVQKEFPDLEVSGDGIIDYHFTILPYYIFQENGAIHVAYDEDEDTVEEFEIDEDGCFVAYNIVDENFVIPNGVTRIDDFAFEHCTRLQSITIPDSVTSIGDGAFSSCTSLQSITIPNSVTSIGESAFRGCTSLQSIISPKIPIESWDSSELKRAATLGYLQKREMFLDTDIAAGYKKYATGQRKKLLPMIFKNDMVVALAFYAEEKKITAKNFEEDYLNPAKEANAEVCIAFLLDWQNKNTKSKNKL